MKTRQQQKALLARGLCALSALAVTVSLSTGTTAYAKPADSGSHAATAATDSVRGSGSQVDTRESARLASEFTSFAGSIKNAQNLVAGLHTGAPITLASNSRPGVQGAVSFRSPTRPLAFDDIGRALVLARSHLEAQGLVRPTPDQVKLALVGGSMTRIGDGGSETFASTGVLELRSQGLEWGQIAHALSMSDSRETANNYEDATAGSRPAAGGMASIGDADDRLEAAGLPGVDAGTRSGVERMLGR